MTQLSLLADVSGNPTYLNVNIPASSIKVTTDAETNTPQGQDVSTKVGEVPDTKKGIKNPDTLPNGTTYTWQNTPNTTTPGKKPAVIVVTYPDGSKDEVPTNVVVNAKPEIKTITTTVGGNPAATEGIANLNNGGTTPVDGYPTSATWTTKPDTSKPGATTGTATVTYPDGTTETVTIPVAVNGQGDTPIIGEYGKAISLHANNVVTHKTSDKNIIGEPVIESFTLKFYDGKGNLVKTYVYTLNGDEYVPNDSTLQNVKASDINIEWTPADTPLFSNVLGEITGHGNPSSLATAKDNGGTGTIKYTNDSPNNQYGYPYYVATVDSSNVTWPLYGKGPKVMTAFPSVYVYGAEANGTIPTVYLGTTDLKAALGDASKFVNTRDLTADHNSEISSVNWQTLPSLAEANPKAPATVRINFTDGSYLDVPVAVNVTPTDADKYTPEGQDVNTKTGVVPNPAEGIKNKSDLPDGTKYTWKDTPDVTTAGDKPATVVVSYPDGSKDEVPVTIHVTNPATDADKYTPEGQDVNTKTGVVPNPAEGIKNKGDLPDETKYTWKDTPDVTKPGESTGVIVVTYPDGSKDEVTVKVVVNTDNVTPETQPIHTTLGVLPKPADAIKNKDEMPVGTKYTWKEVPNVNTLGEHTGVITVTYPDGSSVNLTVKVYVDAVAKENNSNNTAQVITKHVAETNEKKTSATPAQQINHSEKATLPQTGAKSENAAGILGLAIAAVGSLFGLAADKKRRDK
nr:Rib/alpha-like domain-containing protein [Lactobacillus taiwanensis]